MKGSSCEEICLDVDHRCQRTVARARRKRSQCGGRPDLDAVHRNAQAVNGSKNTAIAINKGTAYAGDGNNNTAKAYNNADAGAYGGNNNSALVNGACPMGIVCGHSHGNAGVGSNNTVKITGNSNSGHAGSQVGDTSNGNTLIINGDDYHEPQTVADQGGQTIILPPTN